MASRRNRMNEGNAHMKAGTKAVTKSMFNWSLDWQKACVEYDAAVTSFARAGDDGKELMYEACLKGANAWENNQNPYKASKLYLKAGDIDIEKKEFKQAFDHYKLASKNYVDDNKFKQGADAMVKLAGKIGGKNVEITMMCYQAAVSIWENEGEEKHAFADTTFNNGIKFACDNGLFEDAKWFYQRQRNLYMPHFERYEASIYKAMLAITILNLHLEDWKGAEEAHTSHNRTEDYQTASYGQAANGIFDAIFAADPDQFERACKHGSITALPPHMARLSRRLVLPQDIIDAGPREGFGPQTLEDFLDSGGEDDFNGDSDDDFNGNDKQEGGPADEDDDDFG